MQAFTRMARDCRAVNCPLTYAVYFPHISAMMTVEHVLRLVDNFRAARPISDARLSVILFNDGKRIARLRDGHDVGSRKIGGLIAHLAEIWPPGAAWPEDIPWPASSPATGKAPHRPTAEASP
ncbi:hypothetical protein CHELA20_51598 [Hyphomicrobiales bacterium]|nr:hypothetical protein CHELA41_23414 [Hyphomicrobiales bacterium]CAH1677175.1 hypothetical protein CHELA20_51598 [Hyphomicrobiales bacterium]